MASTTSEPAWGLLLLVLVLVLAGVGLKTAYDQREARLSWTDTVNTRLNSLELKDSDAVKQCEAAVQRLEQKQLTEQNVRDLISASVVVPPGQPQPEYNHVAGCYGIVPTESAKFNLTCDKNFSWK